MNGHLHHVQVVLLLHPTATCADGCWCPVTLIFSNLRWWCFSFQQLAQTHYLHLWWLPSATCADGLFPITSCAYSNLHCVVMVVVVYIYSASYIYIYIYTFISAHTYDRLFIAIVFLQLIFFESSTGNVLLKSDVTWSGLVLCEDTARIVYRAGHIYQLVRNLSVITVYGVDSSVVQRPIEIVFNQRHNPGGSVHRSLNGMGLKANTSIPYNFISKHTANRTRIFMSYILCTG